MILSNRYSYFKPIIYELLVLDRNTWNYTNAYKQMIRGRAIKKKQQKIKQQNTKRKKKQIKHW